jgi:hypothetical protein
VVLALVAVLLLPCELPALRVVGARLGVEAREQPVEVLGVALTMFAALV